MATLSVCFLVSLVRHASLNQSHLYIIKLLFYNWHTVGLGKISRMPLIGLNIEKNSCSTRLVLHFLIPSHVCMAVFY